VVVANLPAGCVAAETSTSARSTIPSRRWRGSRRDAIVARKWISSAIVQAAMAIARYSSGQLPM